MLLRQNVNNDASKDHMVFKSETLDEKKKIENKLL